MSINLLIGIKKQDGSVDCITVRQDGVQNHNKLLYKYFRTPERVKALIKNGSSYSCLARYISTEEKYETSSLYNEEVSMLPIGIGFPDDNFYEYMNESRSTHTTYQYSNLEALHEDAKKADFNDHDIYLYDPETESWSIGVKQIPLREHIVGLWHANHDNHPEQIEETLEELNNKLDAIDEFISKRKEQANERKEPGTPHMLKGVELYLKVIEQNGRSKEPRKIFFLPITKEIENMRISDIPQHLGITYATIEVYHDMKIDNNVSSAYRATWLAEDQTVISFTIFSLLEAIENNASMQETAQRSRDIFDHNTIREKLAETESKERKALSVLSKVIDEETLNEAAERIRKLGSPVGIYQIMDDLEILKSQNGKTSAIDDSLIERKEQANELAEPEIPHMLKGAELYLKVVEAVPYYSDRPRRVYFLPITKEIENMKISDIPQYLEIENASVEVCHERKSESNVSSAYRDTWLAGDQTVINFTVFSLLEGLQQGLKRRRAYETLSKIIDENLLKEAEERVRQLGSPVGIYQIMEELEILEKPKSTRMKL